MLPLLPLETLNAEQHHENCYMLCRLRVLPQPCLKEACYLIKPIIHARYLLYPVMSTLKNPAMYVVCAVSDKCELCCINFVNRNSRNAERKSSSDLLLLLLLFILFRRTRLQYEFCLREIWQVYTQEIVRPVLYHLNCTSCNMFT